MSQSVCVIRAALVWAMFVHCGHALAAPAAEPSATTPEAVQQQIDLGWYRSAEEAARRAVQQLSQVTAPSEALRTWHLLLAEVYCRSGQFDKGLQSVAAARKVLDRQRQFSVDSDYAAARLDIALWQTRIELARESTSGAPQSAAEVCDDEDVQAGSLALPKQAYRLEWLILREQLADLRAKEAGRPPADLRRWPALRQQAEQLLREASPRLEWAASHASLAISLARCLEAEGKPRDAVQVLQDSVTSPAGTVNPKAPQLQAETGRILRCAKMFHEEAQFWQQTLNDAGRQTGESDKGLAEIERLNARATMRFDLAEALHLEGRDDDVRKNLDDSAAGYLEALRCNEACDVEPLNKSRLAALAAVSRQGLLRVRLAPDQWTRRLEHSLDAVDLSRAVDLYAFLKDSRLQDDPLIHQLELVLGAQYLCAAHLAEARQMLESAYAFFRAYPHAEPATVVQLLVLLAEVNRCQGSAADAEDGLNQAAAFSRRSAPADENLRLWIEVHRARLAADRGKFTMAESRFQAVITAAGEDAAEAGRLARLGLAMLYKAFNHLQDAEQLCRESLHAEQNRAPGGDRDQTLLPYRIALADILLLQSKVDEASAIIAAVRESTQKPDSDAWSERAEVLQLAAALDFLRYKSSKAADLAAEHLAAGAETTWQELLAAQRKDEHRAGEARTCYHLSQLAFLRWQRQLARDADTTREISAHEKDVKAFAGDHQLYQAEIERFKTDEGEFEQRLDAWEASKTDAKQQRETYPTLEKQWNDLDFRRRKLTADAKKLRERKAALNDRFDKLRPINQAMLLAADAWTQQAAAALNASGGLYPNLQYITLCHRGAILRVRATWEPQQAEGALECLKKAVTLLEQPRLSAAHDDLGRAEFLSQYSAAFDQLIDWSYERSDPLEALVYAELCRSRALLDWIGSSADNPHSAERRFGLAKTLTRDSVRTSLETRIRGGELLVYYHLGATNSYVFVIGLEPRIQMFRLEETDPREDLGTHVPIRRVADWVDNYLDLISVPGQFPKASLDAKRKLAAVADCLLPPAVRKQLAAIRDDHALIISPHGPLERIPFEALWVQDDGQARFLIDALPRAIAYVPSLQILDSLEQASVRPDPARPIVTAVCPALAPRQIGGHDRVFPLLEAAVREANRVAEVLAKTRPGRQLSDAEATEAKLRAAVAACRPACLHLATHTVPLGFLDGDTALVLHPGPVAADTQDDGLLTIGELCAWPLEGCELALVSACRVNEGRALSGEMAMSLSRAFLAAGARRLVTSRWSLEDQAGCDFVSQLCDSVADDWRKRDQPCDYAAAVRAARQAARKAARERSPHPDDARLSDDPFFWASFLLIGPARERLPATPDAPSRP